MAGTTITTTQIDNLSQTFIAKALETREHTGVMDKLVDTKRLPNGYGSTYNEPYIGSISAAALTDGLEFDSPVSFTDTNVTVTTGEVGVQTLITKRTNDVVKENLMAIAGRLMSNAIAYKRDTDLLALMDGFGGSFGSGTATLVVGHITSALAMLRSGRAASGGTARTGARTTGDPAPAPYYAVIHEWQRRALAAQLSGVFAVSSDAAIGTTAPSMNFTGRAGGISDYQAKWIEEHYLGTIDGCKVIIDNNLPISSSATKSGVFSKEALINLMFRNMVHKTVETDDGRAVKTTLVDDYGTGERNDIWGIELNIACVAPTT